VGALQRRKLFASRRRFSLLFDIAILALAGFTGWRMVGAYHADSRYSSSPGPLLQRGSASPIAQLPSASSPSTHKSIVLFLSTRCKACEESLPFYEELVEYVDTHPGLGIVATAAEPTEKLNEWLTRHKVSVSSLRELRDPSAIGFSLTPTLLLVDSNGTVSDIALGKLTVEQQKQLFERLGDRPGIPPLDNTNYADEIEVDEYRRRGQSAAVRQQVIDINDRADFRIRHLPESRNVPFDELAVRAPIELITSQPVSIACQRHSLVRCRLASHRLREIGFPRVSIIVY
jgi:rhodanese-related sulfurtransferase